MYAYAYPSACCLFNFNSVKINDKIINLLKQMVAQATEYKEYKEYNNRIQNQFSVAHCL